MHVAVMVLLQKPLILTGLIYCSQKQKASFVLVLRKERLHKIIGFLHTSSGFQISFYSMVSIRNSNGSIPTGSHQIIILVIVLTKSAPALDITFVM